jgi:hypothetical protein
MDTRTQSFGKFFAVLFSSPNDPKCKTCGTTMAGALVNVRLFKRPRDYPTTFLKEIHAPRSSWGDLNIDDFPILFNMKAHFEVCFLYMAFKTPLIIKIDY